MCLSQSDLHHSVWQSHSEQNEVRSLREVQTKAAEDLKKSWSNDWASRRGGGRWNRWHLKNGWRVFFRQSEGRLGGMDSWGNFKKDWVTQFGWRGSEKFKGMSKLMRRRLWSSSQGCLIHSFQCIKTGILKVWSGAPGFPETLSEGLWGQGYFRIICSCLTHLLRNVQWVFFSYAPSTA